MPNLSGPRETRPSWLPRVVGGLGLVVLIVWIGSSEIGRWYEAAARNAFEDEEFDDAIEAATKGLVWNPENRELILVRAQARLSSGDFAGTLAEYDHLASIAAKNPQVNEADIAPLEARAFVLQRMDRPEEAIRALDEVVAAREEQFRLRDDDESRRMYSLSLNNRAYVKAQEEIDIENGIAEVKLALELDRDDSPVVLDTLGYLLLKAGKLEAASAEFEKAVTLQRTENAVIRRLLASQMRQVVDQRPFEKELKARDENYAVILHHRGEVRAAMGDEEGAQQDFAEAEKLGYDPEKGVW